MEPPTRSCSIASSASNIACVALTLALAGVHCGAARIVPTLAANLASPSLVAQSVPLPLADLRFAGQPAAFRREVVLVQFHGEPSVAVLRVPAGAEAASAEALRRRADVDFAVLDTTETRQFSPNDPLFTAQWHHALIGSPQAWNYSLGAASVRIAIVDTPFQMDHPDLATNTVAGWDVDSSQPVASSQGIAHSTLCAGMAAAVINNGLGVAGAANCQVLPININGAISDMYNAVIWAAGHGVRVVNISWSGATNAVLEAAGAYLKTNAGGVLIMSATDGTGLQAGPNQPDVVCVSMTDSSDNFQGTLHGAYIDFAAPGYDIYSTTIHGGYDFASGCSFSAPLVAGIVGWMLSVNPTLQPADVFSILQNTAVDLGQPGWDPYFGWGRVDFGAAAAATVATLPNILSVTATNGQVSVSANYRSGLVYQLWRTLSLGAPAWTQVSATLSTNGAVVSLTDSSPPRASAFYRVRAVAP